MFWLDREEFPIPFDIEVLAIWKGRVGILFLESEKWGYFCFAPGEGRNGGAFDEESIMRIDYWHPLPSVIFKSK